MRYRPVSGTSPCRQCPFRRSAPAGWLGEANPQSFIAAISLEQPLPCHPTINYGDPGWLEKWKAGEIGRICAGSLILSANMGKLPRDRAFPRLPPDDTLVFSNHRSFIAHHEAAETRSWELVEGAPREIRMGIQKKKTTPLTNDQLRMLITHSRIGRQSSHTQAIRADAQAALSGDGGAPMEAAARTLRDLTTDPEAIGVHRIDRSPTNPHRWVLSLFCGHDAWVTTTGRTTPAMRTSACAACRERAERRAQEATRAAQATVKKSPGPVASEPRRRFRVLVAVIVDVDQRLIDVVTQGEWQSRFYPLATAGQVAGHLAYNLVQGRALTDLDGFADQADDMARIEEVSVDDDDEVVEIGTADGR